MDTPVALLFFRRPELTKRVFQVIREARPKKLFLIADGPRSDRNGEAELCQQTRDVVSHVDWECEVLCNYSDVNLGCRERISSGITWVFEHVEEAVFLEDDCLPSLQFFVYCEQMLRRYRDDSRVMHISGDNFQFGIRWTKYDYYFSMFAHIWGWATWKRAWARYDVNMGKWPEMRDEKWLNALWRDKSMAEFWRSLFQRVYDKELDTWDVQWLFACWVNEGLSVLPSVNLVSNIGFGGDAHHTTSSDNLFAEMPIGKLRYHFRGPNEMRWCEAADRFTYYTHYKSNALTYYFAKAMRAFYSRSLT